MKIIILTQDEPFFLGKSLDYLFSNLPNYVDVVGCVCFEPSPFGKKKSLLQKVTETYNIFGLKFLIRYAFKAFQNKFDKSNNLTHILSTHNILKIGIDENINAQSSLQKLKDLNPDLLISITGNQIFKKELIELAPLGCLNLHTALLPKYRGIMPSFWVLRYNETYTGVSVFFVDEGIDSGPILVQKKIKIGERTQEELIIDSKKIGMAAIIEGISLIKQGNYNLIENNDNLQSYYKFPTKFDVIEFKKNGKKFY